MKKSLCIALFIAGTIQAQTYVQHEVGINGSVGINHELVGDIEYNPSTASYRSAHKTDRGMAVYNYDEVTGAVLDVQAMFRTSGNTSLYPITIVDNTAITYILFGYNVGGMDRYGVLRYNNAANVVSWINYLNINNNNVHIVPTDMHVDINTGDAYITGNMVDAATDESDFFAARVDNSGSLLWHMEYPDALWDDRAFSIFYYSDTEIYIGVASFELDPTVMNSKGRVIQIDNTGAVQQNIALVNTTYNDCDRREIVSTSVKRLKEEIFVLNTSINHDSPGFHSLYKFDPSLNVLDYAYIYPGPGTWFFEPLFEFSDNGTIINCSGDSRVLNLTDGYIHANFATSDFSHTGSFRYPYTFNDFAYYGKKHMRTSWSSNQNELMAVMDNNNNAADFHMIKSGERGQLETDCDIVTDYKLAECRYDIEYPELYPQQWIATFPALTNFVITPITERVVMTCDNSCPDCKFQTISGDKGENQISLYPNPVADMITINSNNGIQQIEILDVQGKLMLSITQTEDQLFNNEFKIESLKSGIYFIHLTDGNGQTTVHKLIKE